MNVATDQRMWSQTYDRRLDDVFKVQDDIAGAVVHALQINLLAPAVSGNRTENSDAYNHYLLGRQFLARFNQALFARAIEEFRAATSLDPAFAAAWAGLADAHFWQADIEETALRMEADRSSARAAADKALELQPDLVYGLLVRGLIRRLARPGFCGRRRGPRARARARPGQFGCADGLCEQHLMPKGRFEEAERMLRKATVCDPLNARVWTFLGFSLSLSGDGSAARSALARSLEINPQQTYAPGLLAAIDLVDGHPTEALAMSQRSTTPRIQAHECRPGLGRTRPARGGCRGAARTHHQVLLRRCRTDRGCVRLARRQGSGVRVARTRACAERQRIDLRKV